MKKAGTGKFEHYAGAWMDAIWEKGKDAIHERMLSGDIDEEMKTISEEMLEESEGRF